MNEWMNNLRNEELNKGLTLKILSLWATFRKITNSFLRDYTVDCIYQGTVLRNMKSVYSTQLHYYESSFPKVINVVTERWRLRESWIILILKIAGFSYTFVQELSEANLNPLCWSGIACNQFLYTVYQYQAGFIKHDLAERLIQLWALPNSKNGSEDHRCTN